MKLIIKYLLKILGYKLEKYKKQQSFFNPEKVETFSLTNIHYGCYRKYLTDWLNVDLDISESKEFKTAKVNLTQRHPFEDNSFKFGFAEDFVACINQSELIIFLTEVYRTFRTGGVLRISTPGLDGVLKKHYPNAKFETALLAKSEAFDMWGNIQFPSLSDLEMISKHIGFSDIKQVEYGMSEYFELKNLDTRSHQIGLNTYVEITK